LFGYWLKERRERITREEQKKKREATGSELQTFHDYLKQWPRDDVIAIGTFSLHRLLIPKDYGGCHERPLIFFPASSWQWWMVPLEQCPCLHAFCEALSIQ
jgi:hypothetical protein